MSLPFALPALSPRIWLAIGVIALIAAAAIGFVVMFDHAGERTVKVAAEAGGTAAVAAGQQQTLEQLKDANNAQQDLRHAGERSADRYDQCLLDSDRPAACERYKPIAPAE
jgi:hypothetical protein